MNFRKLEIKHWQQFEDIEINLHDRLTVITGSNGSGKTTILNIFARHFGWQVPSLSTPKEEKGTGVVKFFSRLFNGEDKSNSNVIGKIEYSNGVHCSLSIQNTNAAQYQLALDKQLSLIHI